MKTPELLVPAGSLEKLKIAIHYGADAVYLGKPSFSLRAMTGNFETDEEIDEAVRYAHMMGVKVYVTVNIFPHNKDLSAIKSHLGFINELAVDGIILSDVGVLAMAKKEAKKIPVHISTQANVTNYANVLFWKELGAKRVNLARELSFEEIREIRRKTDIELEVFVHGAVCISYSGRCYISAFLADRSANRGECTNSCRWKYALVEEKRAGQYFPVFENERGSYLMNSRDLCLIEYLPQLVDVGIDSLKIEGRMKGINYVAGVTHCYRKALDDLKKGRKFNSEHYLKELLAFAGRGYTTGMFTGKHPACGYNLDGRQDMNKQDIVAIVKEVKNGRAILELKRPLKKGNEVYFLSPSIEDTPFVIKEMLTLEKEITIEAKAGDIVLIDVPSAVRCRDIVRIMREDNED